jgi:hypothetical protein
MGEQSLSEIVKQFGKWVETSVKEAGEKFLTELNGDLLNAKEGQRVTYSPSTAIKTCGAWLTRPGGCGQ